MKHPTSEGAAQEILGTETPTAQDQSPVQGQNTPTLSAFVWREEYGLDEVELMHRFRVAVENKTDRRFVVMELFRRLQMIDELLNHTCDQSGECSKCGEIVCPFGESLHFHHDGCPACCIARGEVAICPQISNPDKAVRVSNP